MTDDPTAAELHRNQVRIDAAIQALQQQFGHYVTTEFLGEITRRFETANRAIEEDFAEERRLRARADSEEQQERKAGDAANAREISRWTTTVRWVIGTLIAIAALLVTIYSIRGQ